MPLPPKRRTAFVRWPRPRIWAALDLGTRHEIGAGVEADPARARSFYRLCATAKQAVCQYRLGKLLIEKRERADWEFHQGMAWLQLASDSGFIQATNRLAVERTALTDEQANLIEAWRKSLAERE